MVSVLIAEESLRVHLRHATQHPKPLLKNIAKKRPNSRFDAFIALPFKFNSSAPFSLYGHGDSYRHYHPSPGAKVY